MDILTLTVYYLLVDIDIVLVHSMLYVPRSISLLSFIVFEIL